MENPKISNFMLERYRLGELLPEDRKALEDAFAADENNRSRIIVLDESDRELRNRHSAEFLNLENHSYAKMKIPGRWRRLLAKAFRLPKLVKIAVVILLCLTLPLVYYFWLHN